MGTTASRQHTRRYLYPTSDGRVITSHPVKGSSAPQSHFRVYCLGWLSGKESACRCRRHRFNPELGRSSGRGNDNPLQCSFWKTPWTKEPGRLQFMGSQRIKHDWACTHARCFPNGGWLLVRNVCQSCQPIAFLEVGEMSSEGGSGRYSTPWTTYSLPVLLLSAPPHTSASEVPSAFSSWVFLRGYTGKQFASCDLHSSHQLPTFIRALAYHLMSYLLLVLLLPSFRNLTGLSRLMSSRLTLSPKWNFASFSFFHCDFSRDWREWE